MAKKVLQPGDYVKMLTGAAPNDNVYVIAVAPEGFMGLGYGVKGDQPTNYTQAYYYPNKLIAVPKAEAGKFYQGPGQSVGVGQNDGSLRLVYCSGGKPVKDNLKMEFDPDLYKVQAE